MFDWGKALDDAIHQLNSAPKVNIKGKEYATVATRVECFRNQFSPPEWGIITECFGMDQDWVRVKATITYNGQPVATGMGEENRSQGPINRTSALENCETSAVGRALSAFGLHGGEYASANEVQEAIATQESMKKDYTKSNLKARAHEICREINSCEDGDQLLAYWQTKDIQDALKRMKTHYAEGFEACMDQKDDKVHQFERPN